MGFSFGDLCSSVKDLVLIPHFFTNILLSITYFLVKTTPPICEYMFWDCKLELREWEWITFLGCVIVLKNRRQVTYQDYLSTACLFTKGLNGFLFFKQNPLYGLVYALLCLFHIVFLPEPAYSGPENVTYFRGPNLLETLEKEKRNIWVIEFYAAWSPPCVSFAPTFAEISSEYSLSNLKFGKIDVSRYPELGSKFMIKDSALSKQFPSVLLFQDGKEIIRRPFLDGKGKVLRYMFSKENVIRDFELNSFYSQCSKSLPKKRDKDKSKKDN